MESLQRKESSKISPLSIDHLPLSLSPSPSPSPIPLPHKTSIFSPSSRSRPIPIRPVSQKRQYQRLKLLFLHSSTQYYTTQIRSILQDEVRKIKQSNKLKNMIQTLKTTGNKEIIRQKHHQRVALVSEQVKQKELQKSVSGLEGYLKKRQEEDKRVGRVVREKKQMWLNRSSISHRMSIKQQEEMQRSCSSVVNYHDASITERKQKSIIPSNSSKHQQQQRQQKLKQVHQRQQQMKITTFLTRMKSVQENLARREIIKHQKIDRMKQIPARCLTGKRHEIEQNFRTEWEKHYNIKEKKTESYIESKSKEKDLVQFEKSVKSLEHSRVVFDKRQEMNRNSMELKQMKSLRMNGIILQKRGQHESVLQMKKEFKLKKQYEKENNSRLMRKLVDKITNLKLVDSRNRMKEEEIGNFERLLRELEGNESTWNNKKVQEKNVDRELERVFRETKWSVASKIVADEEARSKGKKVVKKSHRD